MELTGITPPAMGMGRNKFARAMEKVKVARATVVLGTIKRTIRREESVIFTVMG